MANDFTQQGNLGKSLALLMDESSPFGFELHLLGFDYIIRNFCLANTQVSIEGTRHI
jgi:hypothetical protein